jgi:hypothetical protein
MRSIIRDEPFLTDDKKVTGERTALRSSIPDEISTEAHNGHNHKQSLTEGFLVFGVTH